MNHRPLSPHLQVYRLPLTGVLSICHRFSGMVLSLGAVVLVLVPVSLVSGAESFNAVHQSLASVGGRTLLWLWIVSFLFHLCHGCRHLLWDIGFGFCRLHLTRNAWLELVALAGLLVMVWASSSYYLQP